MPNEIKVDILFYIEKGEIVMDSPQLDIGTVQKLPSDYHENIKNLVIRVFEEKLSNKIARFDSKEHFIKTMLDHGSLDMDKEGMLKAKELTFFLEKFEYLNNFMKEKGLRRIKHTITL
ncbi:hypothetical protein [Maribacter luteus]|uniref:hypothetical protein n=1 Tax=Maribacter luteus TaxID=2594478 RepID=UPI002493935A|nr:hypothetical protein [Maribacter luteus]